MSEGEEAISLSEAESEGDGPRIRPPQHSASLTKHKAKKRKRSRESSKYKRRSDERQSKDKSGRDYDRRRERDRSRYDVDTRRDRGENHDLRDKIIRDRYDRDRDRDRPPREGERRHYDRTSDKRKDKSSDLEERKNRILMADKMLEEKKKEAEARKKTKLLEKEMERLQRVLKRKKAGQRSRSRSKGHRKKEKRRKKSRSVSSESGSNEEAEAKNSGSEEESEDGEDDDTEVEEEQSESEEESESGEESGSTASQKSEDTPEHEDNSSEDGEVEEDEDDKKLEEMVEKKSIKEDKDSKPREKESVVEKSPVIGGKWADKSPNRTPSRSPTPLKEESDGTPGRVSAKGSRVNSPAVAPSTDHHMDSPPASPVPIKDELPPYLPSVNGCRDVAEFKCLNRIEEGTYGVVFRARDKRTNEIVALKKLKMEREKEGFPITSLREVNTLLIGQHPNVVHVREIVVGSIMDHIFIVMDFVQHDLKTLMETLRKKEQVFLPGEVKCLMIQLLRAIAHLHDNWILHRDLKASNLLLSHKGILKVGDFGLAREYGSPLKHYTSIVVTLWYRSPELLLGIKLLGTPSERVWPGYKDLPGVQRMKFVEQPVSHLREKFPVKMLSAEGLQLLKDLLCYDPKKRISCDEALKADYFQEDPRPIDPSMFPTWPAKSEQEPGDKVKKIASPKPPSGGHAFKKNMDDDDEAGASSFQVRGGVPAAGWNLKF